MRALATLTAVIGLGAVSTSFASTAHAQDWSIGFGVGLPGVVVVAPPPAYIPPPPRYYYPPGYYYYPPEYYRQPVYGYGGYREGHDYDRDRHHHHHEHEDDDDEE
jgi:hypothetical protein